MTFAHHGYWPLPGPARCQHCESDIWPQGQRWADRSGFVVCMKYTGTLPAREQDFVYHTPLPEVA